MTQTMNLCWFLTHVWLGSVSKVLCFTAVAFSGIFKKLISKKNIMSLTCNGLKGKKGAVKSLWDNFVVSFSDAVSLSSPCFPCRYKLWGVWKARRDGRGGGERHNRGRISHSGLFTNAERRLEIVSKTSTAALEHLRTGEGRNGCPAGKKKKRQKLNKNWENFMLTECLYAKHVQWRTCCDNAWRTELTEHRWNINL